MEIDTLILYRDLYKNDMPDLINLINQFHEYVRYVDVGHLPSNEIEGHAKLSALSFSEYVREVAHQKKVEIDFSVISAKLSEYDIH